MRTTAGCLAGIVLALGAAPRLCWAEPEVIIALKEAVELESLIKAVGMVEGAPLVWDPMNRGMRGRTVVGSLDLRVPQDAVFAFLRGLLVHYDLALVPVGPAGYEVWHVVDLRTDSALGLKPKWIRLTPENNIQIEAWDGVFVTTVIKLEFPGVTKGAGPALSHILSRLGSVVETEQGLIVTGFAPNVVAIYRLVMEMDAAAADKEVRAAQSMLRVVELKHASAMALVQVLARLFPSPVDGLKVDADDRTNQLLLRGSASAIASVMEVVRALDIEPRGAGLEVDLLPLHALQADGVAAQLSALIQAAPGLWRDLNDRQAQPVVVPSRGVNALVVSGAPRAVGGIRDLVEEMETLAKQRAAEAK